VSVITYTALRELISAHTASVQYSMEVNVKQLDTRYATDRTRHTSIGGNVQTVFRSTAQLWAINMGSFARTSGEGSMEQILEFFASVERGEEFAFDAYGTIASPDNVQTVILEDDSNVRNRLGNLERYDVPLTLRVVA